MRWLCFATSASTCGPCFGLGFWRAGQRGKAADPSVLMHFRASARTPQRCVVMCVHVHVDRAVQNHNAEVERATKTLLTETVTKVAAVMESQPFSLDDSHTIVEIVKVSVGCADSDLQMHRYGVNMRLLSYVFAHVHQQRIRARLLTEMVSRLIKNTVRQQLRKVHAVDTKACHEVRRLFGCTC